jgi:hypothetical protein
MPPRLFRLFVEHISSKCTHHKTASETKLNWRMRITFAFNRGVVYVFGYFHCVSSELYLVFKFYSGAVSKNLSSLLCKNICFVRAL